MKVLIACEFSGRVRDAFKLRGHDAWSCDFLPTEVIGNHIQEDVLNHLNDGWDLMIAHPPCTYLALSGIRWMYLKDGSINQDRKKKQDEAIEFVKRLYYANIKKICIENPMSILSTKFRKPTQYIEPYWFGDAIPKKTCLWLKNLPPLEPTEIVEPIFEILKDGRKVSPICGIKSLALDSIERAKWRSRTFQGVANAMAEQWGGTDKKYLEKW